jgi:sugar lactone lactonase YvrE
MKTSEAPVDLSELWNSSAKPKDQGCVTTAVRILDTRCLCGEGILFDDRTSTIMFVDIEGKTFQTLTIPRGEGSERHQLIHTVFSLPKMMGSFGMLETQPPGTTLPLLCAWEDGFQFYDIVTDTELSPMSQGPDVNPAKNGSRLNDGRVDPIGQRYICGGYYGEQENVTMTLFKVHQRDSDRALVHEPLMDGIRVTNALCWSLDGTRMYFADSPTKEVVSFAYDKETGDISDRKLVRAHEPTFRQSVPDGACVDTEGYLWNAIYNWSEDATIATGQVIRIHPVTGEVVYTVRLPDSTSQVTCCCFGGQNLDILFITTAAKTKEDLQPHGGAVYAAKVPFTGRKEFRFNYWY